jgi:DNA-binding NarL/FixJ family response regulator
VIRILLVDDHPALRAGLSAVIRAEPGLVALGAAESEAELWPALHRTRPDVVVLDYHLPDTDGLQLCRRMKREIPPPAVLIYSAYADGSLVIPALLAGADGLVHKGAPARELYDAIRQVAQGRRTLPPVSREQLEQASARLDGEDLPVLTMALDGTPQNEIAEALRVAPTEVAARLDRMMQRLKVDVASARLNGG